MRMCVDYRKLKDLTKKDLTIRYPGSMNDSTRYLGLSIEYAGPMYRAITKLEVKSAASTRQHSKLITDYSSTAFYPLDVATP
jgi:hypothetical protein